MSGERQHPAKTKGAHPGSEAIEKGADGLVLVATGAGGHAGRQSPFALVQETRAWFDGPIALSGSIAHGSSILAAEAMGADFAYIGSAFIATQEAHAQPEYKKAVIEGSAEDIVYTDFFTGVWGNYLGPSIVAAGMDPQNIPSAHPSDMDFGGPEGGPKVKAWKDVWGCGQGQTSPRRARGDAEAGPASPIGRGCGGTGVLRRVDLR